VLGADSHEVPRFGQKGQGRVCPFWPRQAPDGCSSSRPLKLMYAAPLRDQMYASYQIQVSSFDDLGNTQNRNGTGFIVGSEEKFFFVSNRHVLDPNYPPRQDAREFHIREVSIQGKGKNQEHLQFTLVDEVLMLTPDDLEDDVAIWVNPRLAYDGAPTNIYFHYGIEALADERFFEDLLPGETIFISGFPDSHDKGGRRPILCR
jgi:hypothetical protein